MIIFMRWKNHYLFYHPIGLFFVTKIRIIQTITIAIIILTIMIALRVTTHQKLRTDGGYQISNGQKIDSFVYIYSSS